MASRILGPKAESFALKVISLYKRLTEVKRECVLSKQLLRSGTSIGANLAEGVYAQSEADFISKYRIALKEANESAYWIRLLYKSGYISQKEYADYHSECSELVRMLAAAVRKMEEKGNAGKRFGV